MEDDPVGNSSERGGALPTKAVRRKSSRSLEFLYRGSSFNYVENIKIKIPTDDGQFENEEDGMSPNIKTHRELQDPMAKVSFRKSPFYQRKMGKRRILGKAV